MNSEDLYEKGHRLATIVLERVAAPALAAGFMTLDEAWRTLVRQVVRIQDEAGVSRDVSALLNKRSPRWVYRELAAAEVEVAKEAPRPATEREILLAIMHAHYHFYPEPAPRVEVRRMVPKRVVPDLLLPGVLEHFTSQGLLERSGLDYRATRDLSVLTGDPERLAKAEARLAVVWDLSLGYVLEEAASDLVGVEVFLSEQAHDALTERLRVAFAREVGEAVSQTIAEIDLGTAQKKVVILMGTRRYPGRKR